MFDKKKIDIIYRVICLIVFSIVVLFVNSSITLGVLVLFFFLATKNDNDFTFVILYVISFLFFFISYTSNNYGLMKLGIIIDYIFYFLNVPSMKKLLTNGVDKIIDRYSKEKEVMETEKQIDNLESIDEIHYMRFSNNKEKNKRMKGDTITVFYITVHFVVLFVSILVG